MRTRCLGMAGPKHSGLHRILRPGLPISGQSPSPSSHTRAATPEAGAHLSRGLVISVPSGSGLGYGARCSVPFPSVTHNDCHRPWVMFPLVKRCRDPPRPCRHAFLKLACHCQTSGLPRRSCLVSRIVHCYSLSLATLPAAHPNMAGPDLRTPLISHSPGRPTQQRTAAHNDDIDDDAVQHRVTPIRAACISLSMWVLMFVQGK